MDRPSDFNDPLQLFKHTESDEQVRLEDVEPNEMQIWWSPLLSLWTEAVTRVFVSPLAQALAAYWRLLCKTLLPEEKTTQTQNPFIPPRAAASALAARLRQRLCWEIFFISVKFLFIMLSELIYRTPPLANTRDFCLAADIWLIIVITLQLLFYNPGIFILISTDRCSCKVDNVAFPDCWMWFEHISLFCFVCFSVRLIVCQEAKINAAIPKFIDSPCKNKYIFVGIVA